MKLISFRKKWVAVGVLSLLTAGCILANVLPGVEAKLTPNQDAILLSPSVDHPFGTDSVGRDIFWLTFKALWVSVLIGSIATVALVFIGIFLGMIAGMNRNFIGESIMRAAEFVNSVPTVAVVVIVLHVITNRRGEKLGLLSESVIIGTVLGSFSWMTCARICRARTIEIASSDFVTAAVALGCTPWRTIYRHIMPNVIDSALNYGTIALPGMVIYESFLSYLGLGIQPPAASIGTVLRDATNLLTIPNPDFAAVIFPSSILVLLVISFRLLSVEK